MTNSRSYRKASFVSRLIVVFAFTLLFIFSALVVLENVELRRIIPHSTPRSLALLFGYCVAILSTNYFMALKGRTLTDWFTEILIALNFVAFLAAMLLPSLFPLSTELPCSWWKPWCTRTTSAPNESLYWFAVLQVPLFVFAVIRVRRFFRSEEA